METTMYFIATTNECNRQNPLCVKIQHYKNENIIDLVCKKLNLLERDVQEIIPINF